MHPKISFLIVNSVKEVGAGDVVKHVLEQLEFLTFQKRVAAFNLLFGNRPSSCCPQSHVHAWPGRGVEAVPGSKLEITQFKPDFQLCDTFSLIAQV